MVRLKRRGDGSQFKDAYVIFTACGDFLPDSEFWKFQEVGEDGGGRKNPFCENEDRDRWQAVTVKGVCTQAQCISHVTHVLTLYFLKSHTSSWLAVNLRPNQLWVTAQDFSLWGSLSDTTSLRVHIKCIHIVPQSFSSLLLCSPVNAVWGPTVTS